MAFFNDHPIKTSSFNVYGCVLIFLGFGITVCPILIKSCSNNALNNWGLLFQIVSYA